MSETMKSRSGKKAPRHLLATAAFVISGFCSCSMPMIGSDEVAKAKDTIPPVIRIDSPADRSVCANLVEVKGRVTDQSLGGAAGGVAALSYEILGTSEKGTAVLDNDGFFTALLDTSTAGDSFTLILAATDWRGNSSTGSRSLSRQAGTAVLSFAAQAGNGTATLSWDPALKAQRYDLYYTKDGTLPGPGNGTIVQDFRNGATVAGLPNGSLCVFLLAMIPEPGYQGGSSDYARAIPLSPRTLAPQVKGDIGLIRVRWPAMAAQASYELQRRAGVAGDFIKIAVLSGQEYIDREAAKGIDYYYRIKPAAYDSVPSDANSARLALVDQSPFLGMAIAPGNDPAAASLDIETLGNKSYVANGRAGFMILDVTDPVAPKEQRMPVPSDPKVAGSSIRSLAVSSAWLCLVANPCLIVYALDAAGNLAAAPPKIIPMSAPFTGVCSYNGPQTVAIKDNYAFVACGGQGIQSVNLATGTVIQAYDWGLEANVTDAKVCNGVLVTHAYSYNATPSLCSDILNVYSIAANGALSLIASKSLGVNNNVGRLAVYSSTALYALIDETWLAVSLQTPSNPLVSVVKTLPFRTAGIDVMGTMCLVFPEHNPRSTMAYQYDVTDPAKPVLRESYEVPIGGNAASIKDSTLLLAADATGVQVIRDPRRTIRNIGYLDFLSSSFGAGAGMALQGPLCALVIDNHLAGDNLLGLVDLTDPVHPRLLSTTAISTHQPKGLAISGTTVYVMDSNGGLTIFDVSNPSSPSKIKTVPVGGTGQGIAIHGDRAYVSNDTASIRIVDISDLPKASLLPESIQLRDKCNSQLLLDGSLLYGTAGGLVSSIQRVDLQALWKGVTTIPIPAFAFDLKGDNLFFCGDVSGNYEIKAVSILDPLNPAATGSAACPGWGDTVVSGGYAFVRAWGTGIHRYSVTRPDSLVYLQQFSGQFPAALAVQGSLCVLSTKSGGNTPRLEVWSMEP